MSDNGFSDTFDRGGGLGVGWGDGWTAKWAKTPAPKPGDDRSMTCLECGNVVTIKAGETIPYGDPRLCEHIGRAPGREQA